MHMKMMLLLPVSVILVIYLSYSNSVRFDDGTPFTVIPPGISILTKDHHNVSKDEMVAYLPAEMASEYKVFAKDRSWFTPLTSDNMHHVRSDAEFIGSKQAADTPEQAHARVTDVLRRLTEYNAMERNFIPSLDGKSLSETQAIVWEQLVEDGLIRPDGEVDEEVLAENKAEAKAKAAKHANMRGGRQRRNPAKASRSAADAAVEKAVEWISNESKDKEVVEEEEEESPTEPVEGIMVDEKSAAPAHRSPSELVAHDRELMRQMLAKRAQMTESAKAKARA